MNRLPVLVVSKLDRLGRDVVEVVTTVNQLAAIGVKVHLTDQDAPTRKSSGLDAQRRVVRGRSCVLTAASQFDILHGAAMVLGAGASSAVSR
jgi:hypothetical protein